MTEPHGVRPLYGPAIHQCIAGGDLQKMKQLSTEAETYLAEISAALDKLKAEIAKADGS